MQTLTPTGFPSISRRNCASPPLLVSGGRHRTRCSNGIAPPPKLGPHLFECVVSEAVNCVLIEGLTLPHRFAEPPSCELLHNARRFEGVLGQGLLKCDALGVSFKTTVLPNVIGKLSAKIVVERPVGQPRKKIPRQGGKPITRRKFAQSSSDFLRSWFKQARQSITQMHRQRFEKSGFGQQTCIRCPSSSEALPFNGRVQT